MERRKLGNTDIEVSILALGCWGFAGGEQWGPQEERDSIAAVHASLDMGVNFFDTAPGYGSGQSERVLGKALKGRRKEAVIADKVSSGRLRRDDVFAGCEKSLKDLDTDYIDLIQIHWPNRSVPFEETAQALLELKKAGKVRAIGVSNFGPGDMAEYMENGGEMVSNQLPYSLLWRAIETAILPECRKRESVVLPYSPLMHGLLSGSYSSADDFPSTRARTKHFNPERGGRHGQKGCEELTFKTIAGIKEVCDRLKQPMPQVALAWLCAQKGVASVLAGARNAQQARANAESADLQLDTAILAELTARTDQLKATLGSNPDMWMTPGRYR